MGSINTGDMVRIKDRTDWPTPPRYPMAGVEGDVTDINEEEGFITVHLVKTDIDWAKDNAFVFRLENVEKI
jgi:hypothetical protein